MYLKIIMMTLFIVGLYKFYMKSLYLLNMLLTMEFFSLIIFISMNLMLWNSLEKYILMYFMVMCVCEGAFGLSLLISMIRFTGNDYIQSNFVIKC